MVASVKKTSARKTRSPAKERRSQSRAINAEASLLSSSTTSSPSRSDTPRNTRYSHRLPTDEQRKGNGRVSGRNLILWNRPRMAEKLLLHIQYECSRHKVQLPWDAIAHRLHPGSSGAAVVQHINRLRRELVAEGHLVPPLSNRSAANPDLNIRGYIREDMKGDDCETTRPVGFDEGIEDPKFNLPNDLQPQGDDIMGSQYSSLPGSDEEGDIQESPTPVRRCIQATDAPSSAFEFPRQATAMAEGFAEQRGQSPAQLGYFSYDSFVSNTHSAKMLIRAYHVQDHREMHGSEMGTSPSHSFDQGAASSGQHPKAQQDAAVLNLGGQLNGYRLAWPHPYLYQGNTPPKAPSPSLNIEQQDCFIAPFAISMQPAVCTPYLSLEHSILRSHYESQPVPSEPTTKSEEHQLEVPQGANSQIGDLFLNTVNEEVEDNHCDETGAQGV